MKIMANLKKTWATLLEHSTAAAAFVVIALSIFALLLVVGIAVVVTKLLVYAR